MNRNLLIGMYVVLVVTAPVVASAQDGQDEGAVRSSDARSIREVEPYLFGERSGQDFIEGYTSHFNFDNRILGENPPTTNKYRCMVECVLANGSTRWYSSDDLRRVYVGELDIADVNALKVRVVRCRFWWKLRPLGDWHHSKWAKAEEGYYIVYAFMTWRGYNDYEEPIYFYSEPLEDAAAQSDASEAQRR